MSVDAKIREGLRLLLSGGLSQLSDEELNRLWRKARQEWLDRLHEAARQAYDEHGAESEEFQRPAYGWALLHVAEEDDDYATQERLAYERHGLDESSGWAREHTDGDALAVLLFG